MKLAMTLTVEGLLRTLRGIEHALVEAAEAGYGDEDRGGTRPPAGRPAGRTPMTGEADDSRRD